MGTNKSNWELKILTFYFPQYFFEVTAEIPYSNYCYQLIEQLMTIKTYTKAMEHAQAKAELIEADSNNLNMEYTNKNANNIFIVIHQFYIPPNILFLAV